MKTKWKLTVLLAGLLVVSACAQDEEGQTAVDPVEAMIESAVTVLSGIADDQSGANFAWRHSSPHPLELLLGEQAFAAVCSRAVSQSCSANQKTITYSACQVGLANTLSGNVTLTYSNGSCSMSTDGNTVTRTYEWTLTGPRGGTVTRTSASMMDYTGASYGGGGRLTKTASGFSLDILGKHTELYGPRGTVWYDVSMRTTAALSLNQVARSGRILTGGALQVNHNLAEFTATFVPSNVVWTSSCCHPTGGSISVSYSGSRSGSGTLQFGATCGTATLTAGSETQTVSLGFCE